MKKENVKKRRKNIEFLKISNGKKHCEQIKVLKTADGKMTRLDLTWLDLAWFGLAWLYFTYAKWRSFQVLSIILQGSSRTKSDTKQPFVVVIVFFLSFNSIWIVNEWQRTKKLHEAKLSQGKLRFFSALDILFEFNFKF